MNDDIRTLVDQVTNTPVPDQWEEIKVRSPRSESLERSNASRRSVRSRIVSAGVAFAVFVLAGMLVWRAFEPPTINASGATAQGSATVDGVTVTAPASWTLVDLWPLARSIATWPEPTGSPIKVPADTPT